MITIKEETIIETSPEAIFNFLSRIDSFYKTWHPKDHIFCKSIYRDLNERGCLFHFLETIGGFPLYLILTVSKIKKNEYIEYRPVFPISILNIGMGSFTIQNISEHSSKLIAYVEYGNKLGLLDKILKLFIRPQTIKNHIQEEGENMKKYLEKR